MTDYDVIVIGGGSTGTAVARDCALRGLKTLLLERDDIASATVGTCAGMISSGFKYYDEPDIMDMCSQEVVYFRRIARHIITKDPILMPFSELEELTRGGEATSFTDEYAKRAKERGVPPIMFLSPEQSLSIEPSLNPDMAATLYYEEFFIDPFRLCLLQAIDAKQHGATIRTYCEVTGIESTKPAKSVTFYNRATRQAECAGARLIVNAGGPWAGKVAAMAGAPLELRLNKGAHVILDRRIVNVGISSRAADGRWIYLYPHENTTLLGTTALDTWEDPDVIVASHDEIEYLLKSIEWVVPSIRQARIIRTMEGVRPLVPEWKRSEDKVTRGYRIIDHEKDGVDGLVSFTGGKLVMCRHMAEAVTDLVSKKLGRETVCRTHLDPLPGNEADVDVLALAVEYGLSQHAVERLRARRGTETSAVLALTKEHPEWKSTICTCEPVIEAELRHAIRNEFPQTIGDLRRRVRLGTGPCQGTFCTFKAAAVLAEELDFSGEQYQLEMIDFLAERWKGKRPPMRGGQLGQEELTQGLYACVANLDHCDLTYELKPWEEAA